MRSYFKTSGIVAPQDKFHQVVTVAEGEQIAPKSQIAPTYVNVTITNPGPTRQIAIPQYASTVVGTPNGYNPPSDCNGYFMSAYFQPNNNCYAYGCDIATNTFPQPGRRHGNLITAATLNGPSVSQFAQKDGLMLVGQSISDLPPFAAKHSSGGQLNGHFVALMISAADTGSGWPGDYHWARCDDNTTFASWSQKDGGDQVTDFDFAGQPITNPATANWTVNQGPINPPSNNSELVVSYDFYCFMFVPSGGVVSII